MNDLDSIRKWFAAYTAGYVEGDEGYRKNILLKIKHSGLVCDNILAIARDEALDGRDQLIAGAIGQLHDTGRFPQYMQYRTFIDSLSVNHGELGAQVIANQGVLGPDEDARLVLTAIRYHNAHSVPGLGDKRAEMFIRLIRDADKIDIWRVMLEEFYELPPSKRASAAGLSLPEAARATPELVAMLGAGQIVRLALLGNLKDFILMLMSWCYDMNFRLTYAMLLERGYFERYIALLEGDAEAVRAVEGVRQYAMRRA